MKVLSIWSAGCCNLLPHMRGNPKLQHCLPASTAELKLLVGRAEAEVSVALKDAKLAQTVAVGALL